MGSLGEKEESALESGNKRLMLNTIILYVRMIVVMGVSFYTTRIVLQALGVVDFGLANAISGVIGMFSFISTTLSTACTRYFSCELGRRDYDRLNKTFSLILFIYICVAILILILSETIGMWYLRNKLVFPEGRYEAVVWFYQCSIGTLLAGWLVVPYSALAVTYENMALYSWLSIFDAAIKLIVAMSIGFMASVDSLAGYGVLLLAGSVVHVATYYGIIRVKYSVSRFKWYFDKEMFREIMVFSGWSFWGVLIWMTSDAFVNLLLNSFFGPIINAARAVAMQVNNGVSAFTANFLTAARPQIVKSWAGGRWEDTWVLFKRTTKLGYFLTFVFIVPLCLELPFVLSIWLGEVPQHTVAFTRIVLVTTIVNSFSHPAAYLMQAVGRLGMFEGIGSGIRIFVFPVSYLFLRMGATSESVFYVALAFALLCTVIRLGVLFRVAKLPTMDFVRDVVLGLGLASAICIGSTCGVNQVMDEGWWRLVASCLTSAVVATVGFYSIALNRRERIAAISIFRSLCSRIVRA